MRLRQRQWVGWGGNLPVTGRAQAAIVPEEVALAKASATWTQRAQVEQRMALPECAGCHVRIDAFGLALENYDIIGRFRTQGDQGQPIDASATLPAAFDYHPVNGGVDLSRTIAQSYTYTACLAQSFLHDGLPSIYPPPALDGCAVTDVTARFAASPDQTFSTLIREVALSPVLRRRLVAQ